MTRSYTIWPLWQICFAKPQPLPTYLKMYLNKGHLGLGYKKILQNFRRGYKCKLFTRNKLWGETSLVQFQGIHHVAFTSRWFQCCYSVYQHVLPLCFFSMIRMFFSFGHVCKDESIHALALGHVGPICG